MLNMPQRREKLLKLEARILVAIGVESIENWLESESELESDF